MIGHRIPHRIKKPPTPAHMPPPFRMFAARIAALVQERRPFLIRRVFRRPRNMRLAAIGKFNLRPLPAIRAIN
jgi:hypothetical protein